MTAPNTKCVNRFIFVLLFDLQVSGKSCKKNETKPETCKTILSRSFLDRTNEKKVEITKDISSMAHSAGGAVIYGIREFAAPKKHLPEKLDPIDRRQYPKEWLEQIINLISPRIHGIIIHSVSLTFGVNDVAYVVEIPQSNTAHQALDHRYYRRFNFEAVPMKHYEILDVMNRTIVADASVRFESKLSMSGGERKQYIFLPLMKNSGSQIINNFKLTFTFPSGVSSPITIHRAAKYTYKR